MKNFPSFIELPFEIADHGLPRDESSDQFPASFPRYFIEHLSKKGAKIFDPFMGLGTSAFVAEELGRVPYGIEADGERFEWAAGQLEHWNNIRHGDAADAAALSLPKMDLCVTSPPFMSIADKRNPLYGGDPKYAGYEAYLKRMGEIFEAIACVMKKSAFVVVHVDNIEGKRFTPLVRDMSNALSKSLRPEGEIVIDWQGAPNDMPISRALIFKNT